MTPGKRISIKYGIRNLSVMQVAQRLRYKHDVSRIAEDLGVHAGIVQRIKDDRANMTDKVSNVKPVKRRFASRKIKAEARQLRRTGMNFKDIGKRLGFSRFAVSSWCKRVKVSKQPEPTEVVGVVRGRKAPNEIRARAFELQQLGWPYSKIAKALNCSKSTAQQWVEGRKGRVASRADTVQEPEPQVTPVQINFCSNCGHRIPNAIVGG